MVRTAIILIDHGSRVRAANELLERMADLLRSQTDRKVYAAHMELAEPTLAQAFAQAVADGADRIVVFPYFLVPGRHSRQDIPRMCAEAAAQFPATQWHCTGPFGLDPHLANVIAERVRQCEDHQFRCDDCPDQAYCKNAE